MKKPILLLVILSAMLLMACQSVDNSQSISETGSTGASEATTAAAPASTATAVTTTAATTAAPSSTTAKPAETTKAPKPAVTTARPAGGEIDNAWALFLVNQSHPLPQDFKVETKAVSGTYVMDKRAADYMISMLADAKKAGVKLQVISTYRSVDYQRKLFDKDVATYEGKGMSHEEAVAQTALSVAVPGQSEHNAGLAADILSDEWSSLNEGFEKTKAFQWLSDNAQEYGFILRYPKGKTDLTGITYEPWHYRFVGLYHAQKLKDSGLCLEEYMDTLQ